MRKIVSISALFILLTASVTAQQETGAEEPGWTLLLFTAVIIAALAIYIYFRVQETGLFTFLPQTAMEEE
ncbi:MAG: hypothetical protein MUP63_04400 [Candidatus Nanohaloarchaeota archaeon QJJ-7]|nr:hypothetical protein [Candidatus Nanohaloarchaeota archaeon QJJ-7]